MNGLTVQSGGSRCCCGARKAGRVLFLTELFPSGSDEQWKYGQIAALSERFEEVVIVPFGGTCVLPWTGNFPENVTVLPPLYAPAERYRHALLRGIFNTVPVSPFFVDFITRAVWRQRTWMRLWRRTFVNARAAACTPYFHALVRTLGVGDLVYSYWGFAGAYLLPLIRWSPGVRLAVQLHRGDVFEEHVGGYIPLRAALYGSVDLISTSSEAARKYIVARHPACASKTVVGRLGTTEGGLASLRSDGVFRIVSCSVLTPVKRVQIIVRALHHITFPVEWTHIGDGPMRAEISKLCSSLPQNVKTKFTGRIPSSEVKPVLESSAANVFVNVSSSEGVPISIMEAMMAGIPVIATNTGGTAEVLDPTFAILLNRDLDEHKLADAIQRLQGVSTEQQIAMRMAAASYARRHCNAAKLDRMLADRLCTLVLSAQSR